METSTFLLSALQRRPDPQGREAVKHEVEEELARITGERDRKAIFGPLEVTNTGGNIMISGVKVYKGWNWINIGGWDSADSTNNNNHFGIKAKKGFTPGPVG